MSVRPVLVFACGNPSRGDDALGPNLIEWIQDRIPRRPGWDAIETLVDFQLQIEHALDLDNRRRVLFVDASLSCTPPCTLSPVNPDADPSYTTHAMSPAALLSVYQRIRRMPPPPCRLLAIRGEAFELGAPLSASARRNLDAARSAVTRWLDDAVALHP